jgi:phage gpG-like protein
MAAAGDFPVSDTVTAALQRARDFGDDMSPTMGEIARTLSNSIRMNFLGQHDPLGAPWIRSQRAIDDGGQTLIASSDLFNSITESWGPNFAAAGPEASGGAAVYAAVHQWGKRIVARAAKALRTPFGPRRAVTIPARPYAGWNNQLETDAIDILGDHVTAAISGGARSG